MSTRVARVPPFLDATPFTLNITTGHPSLVREAVASFLEPFLGHLSLNVDKVIMN
jgi:hypothetical protein